MPRITNRQIEAFRAVMLTGTMTAAAELLHISQPAVSRLIQDLEASSGLTLFERRGSHLFPSSDAAHLAEQVERSFIGLGKIEEFIKDIRTQTAGSLRIAAHSGLAMEVLPRFVARFACYRPLVTIRVDALPSPHVADGVASGDLDFGFVQSLSDHPGFVAERLKGDAVVVMRRDHFLCGHDIITIDLLEGQQIIRRFGSKLQDRIELMLSRLEHASPIWVRHAHIACVLTMEGGSRSWTRSRPPCSAIAGWSRGDCARRSRWNPG